MEGFVVSSLVSTSGPSISAIACLVVKHVSRHLVKVIRRPTCMPDDNLVSILAYGMSVFSRDPFHLFK